MNVKSCLRPLDHDMNKVRISNQSGSSSSVRSMAEPIAARAMELMDFSGFFLRLRR